MIYSTLFWMALSCANLVMLIVAYLCAPFLPLFASNDGWLPKSLSWFQTPDNSLDGDSGWAEHFTSISNKYIRRVLWLFRNPCYGFDIAVLGREVKGSNPSITTYGDPYTGNIPIHDGYLIRIIRHEGTPIWQLYFIKGYSLFGERCIRINLGWKVWHNCTPGSFKQFVLSINPWMSAK